MDKNIDIQPVIEDIIARTGHEQKDIIALLHAVEDEFNYLPEDALKCLCRLTGISPSKVMGVATFYSQFRFKPAGKHMIKVCTGTACHVKGALSLFEGFRNHLDIPEGEDTDSDMLFTVEKVACLGCCMIAPAVQIGELTYGPVKRSTIPLILIDYLNSIGMGKSGKSSQEPESIKGTLMICLCSSCMAVCADEVYNAVLEEIESFDLPIKVKTVGCSGVSFQCPLVEIEMDDGRSFRYGLVKPSDVPFILGKHFRPKKILPRINKAVYNLLDKFYSLNEESAVPTRYITDVRDDRTGDYLCCQRQLATERSGRMSPLDIDEYIENRGFHAFEICKSLKPDEIISTIEKSGLRGRGGAGYETARKWRIVSGFSDSQSYIICNGDEGDPGAFMDRMLLESFPFRVIEGMAIAALACGINKGFIFLRSEYPLAISRVRKALEICRKRGYEFNLDIVISAGAFVCGEETALIRSIEGHRGEPKARPPYPSENGLWGKPTLVNNVETFTLVPWIILNGGDAFSGLGTEKSHGTKTFALAGKINNGGLIEVEMGTSLKEIIFRIGDGIEGNKSLKAVQVGGPSGGCLPASLIETPVDYENLKELGTIMGSGGLIVLDEEDCMVDVARYFMSFTQDEACGKCTFGRVGTKRMLEIMDKLVEGLAKPEDLEMLEYLADQIKKSSLCGLCRSAPNPVVSALKYFRTEFDDHVMGRCTAKKCIALIEYHITDDCIGCTKCAQRCPVDAIESMAYEKHIIDIELCVKCDSCRQICPSSAIIKKDRDNL